MQLTARKVIQHKVNSRLIVVYLATVAKGCVMLYNFLTLTLLSKQTIIVGILFRYKIITSKSTF